MHSSLSVAEKLRLVFDSKKFCDSGLASQVFVKARKHIKRDTGVVIRRQLLVKVPMMDHTLKNTLHGIIAGEIARDPKAPTALKDYLVSCITLVRQKTPTVGDLCKSFQLRVPTDDVHSLCSTPVPCKCAHLAEKYGIPLVDGHCVTRDFTWLPDYSAGADVPFVNRPFESQIHGTVNFTQFCCVLLVTWCYRVLLSCYLRPK